MRDSLAYLLGSVDLRCQLFESAERFLKAFDPRSHGCVLLDVQLPGIDGLALQREMVERNWRIPVIVISAHADVRTAVEVIRDGAFDFLEKPFNDGVLLDSVRRAIDFDAEHWDRTRQRDEIQSRLQDLTARELEVLDLVVAGESTKSVAGLLGTSFNTVQNQRASILRKMHARSVADLVRMVVTARCAEA